LDCVSVDFRQDSCKPLHELRETGALYAKAYERMMLCRLIGHTPSSISSLP
jgi:hypothetical protein